MVRGVAKKWFENYRYNRKQYVKYNGVQSEEKAITSGVPHARISIRSCIISFIYK